MSKSKSTDVLLLFVNKILPQFLYRPKKYEWCKNNILDGLLRSGMHYFKISLPWSELWDMLHQNKVITYSKHNFDF